MKPYVIINVAVSVDGKMDTVERRGAGISSPADKQRVDELRAASDAVMVGGHTLINEDPKLTVKSDQLRAKRISKGLSENPIKVGVVSQAKINLNGDFLNAGVARKIIFATSATAQAQVNQLRSLGAEVYIHDSARVDLQQALEKLYELGIKRLMVEGGGTLNYELLRLGLVNEMYIYVAPFIFGGESAPTLAAGSGLVRASAIALKLENVQIFDESGGVLMHYLVS